MTNAQAKAKPDPITPEKLSTLRLKTEYAEQSNKLRIARAMGKAISATTKRMESMARRVGYGRSGRMDRGAYATAKRDRTRTGRRPRGGSAQSHLDYWTQDDIRRDCQALERDHVIARAILGRLDDLTVGDGPIVQSASGDQDWDEKFDQIFDEWMMGLRPELGHPDLARMMTAPAILRAVNRAWSVDGDVAANECGDEQDRYCLQLIEAERICNPNRGMDSDRLKSGIEIDEAGRPIFFHVGQWVQQGTMIGNETQELEAEFVIWLPNPVGFKAGQYRGEPALQAMCAKMERIDSFIESTEMAAYVATCLGLVTKSEDPEGLQAAWEGSTGSSIDSDSLSGTNDRGPDSNTGLVAIGPGFNLHLKKGESAEQVKPEHPTTNFKDFVHTIAQLCGADIGLALALVLFEAGALNFSNLRGLISIGMRSIEYRQASLVPIIHRMRRAKAQEWIEAGVIEAPAGGEDKALAFTVTMPSAPVVDFMMEVEGYALAKAHNWITDDQITQRLGTGRGRALKLKRSEEKKLDAELGITPPELPGTKTPGTKSAGEGSGNGDQGTGKQTP